MAGRFSVTIELVYQFIIYNKLILSVEAIDLQELDNHAD
jgi:hypothetical protein